MQFSNLYVRTAVLASLLVAWGCQSAQRPATLVPSGSAPALKTVSSPKSKPAKSESAKSAFSKSEPANVAKPQAPAPAPSQEQAEKQNPEAAQSASSITPLPDPVADLVDTAE